MTSTQPSTRRGLLEHDEVLVALQEALAYAAEGRGRIVFVAGEAGVGKTALVRRVVESGVANARVLSGACDPLFTPRPLGPLVEHNPDQKCTQTQPTSPVGRGRS